MFKIGCHLSSSNGYKRMGETALSIGANTFQFFSRNPRGSKAKAFDKADADELIKIMNDNNFAPILAHAPYTLNPCSADEGLREFAVNTMRDDLATLANIPNTMYNFHPGSHVGQGIESGIDMIVVALNAIMTKEQSVLVLLETMSGKGSEVGGSFEEIAAIIERVELNEKIGVCLDTCHIYSAGYDIVNDLDGVIEKFDKLVGLSRLKAIHLNDSMTEYDSHKDRHEKIGDGSIGLETVTKVINHPKLREIPFYLETPNELDGYQKEIALLHSLYK